MKDKKDILAEAVDSLAKIPASDNVPADVVEATLENLSKMEMESNRESKKQNFVIERISKMNRYSRIAVAAVVIIAAMLTINQFGGSIDGASVAWGGIVERMQSAETVSYKVTSQVEGGRKKVSRIKFISPFLLRKDILSDRETTIWNYKERKKLGLYPEKKTGFVFDYVNVNHDTADLPPDIKKYFERHLWEHFRKDYEESSEFVGKDEIDGVATDVFTAKHRSGSIKVWTNRMTGLPMRAEITSRCLRIDSKGNTQNGIPVSFVLSDFVWNEPIDESLFAIEAPVGYRIKQFKIDVSHPTEKAMLDAFRATAQLSDGFFLSKFDNKSVTEATRKLFIVDEGKPLTGEQKVAIYQKLMKIKAGFDFVSKLKKENDWHYSGNGVKLGDSKAIIFWWRPDGWELYRIIYGDLSVENVSPDEIMK